MKKEELTELAKHVAKARELGQAAADAVDDGGTCNMDTVCLYLPGTRIASVNAAGVDAYKLMSYVALSGRFGQANKNTTGVRAMVKHLQEQGLSAFVWYQMD